jgi:uncharacterized protein
MEPSRVTENYNTRQFRSAPWCLNGHVHTILCSLLFQAPYLHTRRVRIDTPDDDFLDLDVSSRDEKAPVAVLFHGLEGHSRRYYVRQLGLHLYQRGFTVILVNFRSCSGTMNRQKRFYHSGETEDLHTLFEWVGHHFPKAGYYCAAGFSLGASALLNYLKEHGSNHLLHKTAAISTPFELRKGSLNIDKGFNRIYSQNFLITLKKKLKIKRNSHPDIPAFRGYTLYDFDDQITGPIHGFEGADHYYRECSAYYFTDKIKTSTLVVHSREDPLCPFEWIPVKDIGQNPHITASFPSQGGHVGFWTLPPGWLNKTIGDYFSVKHD